MAEPSPLESSIWTEYAQHVWKYWWLVVVGGVGGGLTVVSLVASVSLPTWVALAILFLGFSVAQILAFKDMRDERNEARNQLRTVAPLSGTVFEHETLRLADIARDLGGVDHLLVNGRRFVDCTITGPGFITLGDHASMYNCAWKDDVKSLFVVLPESRRVIGLVMFLDCAFERCKFDRIGLMGPPELEEVFRAGLSYED